MAKILGLDLGTNSIGWAVVEKIDKKYHFVEIKDEKGNLIPSKGSYIFSKGTTGSENSKAAERRGYRSARKRISRIRGRKVATLKVLEKFDLCPSFNENELNNWKYKKKYPVNNKEFIKWQKTGEKTDKLNSETEKLKQPYYYRHISATQSGLLETKEGRWKLGRAFYHIAQRRGYLSNGEDEQSDDKLVQFKEAVYKAIEETEIYIEFKEAYEVIADTFKSDNKARRLSSQLKKFIDKEASMDKIYEFIKNKFEEPDNLGKVASEILELTNAIEKSGLPTLGSYFYSLYEKNEKIRGRYTHREEHYENEFDFICKKQGISDELKEELHTAIFFQRELKPHDNLIAKCPLEPTKKRIPVSHPLFEKFRMWESINRIKIKPFGEQKLRFFNFKVKELLIDIFQRKNDFEFKVIAKKLSNGYTPKYVKDNNILDSDILFNFPLDKKFSACPVTYDIKKVLGEKFNKLSFYSCNDLTQDVSIEDIWRCLFTKSFGSKSKEEYRIYFIQKWLGVDNEKAEIFAKIKLPQGYGSLSEKALKKIIPFLKKGIDYSHATFSANISQVLGRDLTEVENEKIQEIIKTSLIFHKQEKQKNAIVNSCISVYKNEEGSLGNNEYSIESYKQDVKKQILEWYGSVTYNELKNDEQKILLEECWCKFVNAVKNKLKKDIEYFKIDTIPSIIYNNLIEEFPDDTNNVDINKLYHPSAIEMYPKAENKLGNPEISSIKNPVFNRAMHQLKHLVNELIERGIVDKDTLVNVEVANEINTANYRKALSRFQKEQEEIRDWAKEQIKKLYFEECKQEIEPTDEEITKFIYWKEQNMHCLYTSKNISICEFLGGKITYDIEHTIPRSKFKDNSHVNKTLTDARFNREVKKTELPALLDVVFENVEVNKETIKANRNNYLKSYKLMKTGPIWDVSLEKLKNEVRKYNNAARAISDPVKHDEIKTNEYYVRLKLDYLQKKYKTFEYEEVAKKFTNANLVDTRLIAKYARAYLNSYFSRVNVVNGKITDTLRKIWGLQRENEVKDRRNHIHHCIDAVTVACIEKGIVNRLSEAYHKYEKEYFEKHLHTAKVFLPEPMPDFVKTMKNLHRKVLVYHHHADRLQYLLKRIERKENEPHKNIDVNLRGALNSANPYGKIFSQKENKEVFVQRKPIAKISGADIPNIVDENIRDRIISLAEFFGWKNSIEDDIIEKVAEKKIDFAYKVYKNLCTKDKNGNYFEKEKVKDEFSSNINSCNELIEDLTKRILKQELSKKDTENAIKRIQDAVKTELSTKGLNSLLKESNGILILPSYIDPKNGKEISSMSIKKVRIKTSHTDLKEYKKHSLIIKKEKPFYKLNYYFDKEPGSNYEARIYGSLLPDEFGKLGKRDSEIVNTHNIVKKIKPRITGTPLLQLHNGDMVLVFDKNIDEINWDIEDIQRRLFTIVKFTENKEKKVVNQVIMKRHNYALGDVDNAKSAKEFSQVIHDETIVVLRKTPSVLMVIPARLTKLGEIDIKYSIDYIDKF
ncbi:MAG: hypothetical protein PF481_11160 [Bacteroidales bacterium]|jgi:CRISPR-associated endonuclease Csn1|nr:hypothetical protein [Bacteroidales bacterium]